MNFIEIKNLTTTIDEPILARYCDTFGCRLRGLTFRKNLSPNEGLLLVQKRQNRSDAAIHMFFVWMDLAVIWIDDDFQVVDVRLARSWRSLYFPRNPARYVLEVGPENISKFQIGDRLSFEEKNLD